MSGTHLMKLRMTLDLKVGVLLGLAAELGLLNRYRPCRARSRRIVCATSAIDISTHGRI